MRFCSSSARASSALMSSSVFTTFGFASSACSAASIEGVCAKAGAANSSAAAVDAQSFMPASSAQTQFLQPSGKPVGQLVVNDTTEIDVRRLHLALAQHQQHADAVGEPQIRIGQPAQLVVLVLD